MRLLAPDTRDLLELAAGWLGKYDNYKWLDFGSGVQAITPVALKLMTQRDLHLIRVYTAPDGELPVGVVGLTNLDRVCGTGMVWAVLGNKRYGGSTDGAVARLLTMGFRDLGLRAVSAWTVETNVGARRVLERLHFTYVDRQRQCHRIDGVPLDRLLYDLLASEHRDAA